MTEAEMQKIIDKVSDEFSEKWTKEALEVLEEENKKDKGAKSEN